MEAHKGLRFRQVAMGTAPLLAGVLLIAGMAVTPWEGGEFELTAYYTQMAEHPGRAQLATILIGLGFLAMVPAFATMAQLTRHRATRLGNAGWLFGTIGFGVSGGVALVVDVYDSVLATELGVEQAVALGAVIEELPAAVGLGMTGAFGSLLGLLLMAAALWRSREVPVWGPVLQVVGALLFFLSPPSLIPMLAATSVLLAGLVPVSLRILRATDWELGGPVLPITVPLVPVREPVG